MAMMRVKNCVEIENGNQPFLFFLLFVCLFVFCVSYQPNIDATMIQRGSFSLLVIYWCLTMSMSIRTPVLGLDKGKLSLDNKIDIHIA